MEIAALSEAVGKVGSDRTRGCGCRAEHPRFSCESENFFVLQESFLCNSDYLRFCAFASCKFPISLILQERLLASTAVWQIQPQSAKFSRSLPNSAAVWQIQPRPAGICCMRHPSAILSLTSAPASSNLARRSATWSFFFSSPLTS